MRKLTLFVLSFLFISFNISAQLNALHQMELSDVGERVFLHNYTGIPIFKTKTSYTGVHPGTYQKLWEVKRQGIAGVAEVSGESFLDYFEFPSSTIAYVGNSFVEVVSGQILADGAKDGIKRISVFHLIPEKDLLLVKVITKDAFRLYGFNPVKNTLLWKSDIDKVGALSLTGMGENDPVAETTNGLKPHISAFGDLVYVHQKNMMLIDLTSGNIKWTKGLEPGAILFSKSGKLIAVAERRSGLGALTSSPVFGKRLLVVDAATGEEAWKKEIKLDGNILFIQPYRDGFIAAHEEGFNIYDFNSPKAEPQWKKDFSAKEISDIVEDGNNIMVYYKNRRVLMDPVSGDEVWKKPEKLAKEVPVFTGGYMFTIGDVNITHSGSYLRFNNTKTKAYESFPAHDYRVDEKNNIVVATYTESSSDPVKTGKDIWLYQIDLNTFEVQKAGVNLVGRLKGLDVVNNGYFVYGHHNFILAKFEGDKLMIKKKENYPEPGAFGRGLLASATSLATTTAYAASAVGATKSYIVGDAKAMNMYNNRMASVEMAGNAAFAFQKRASTTRMDDKYAFFFSKDDAGNLALFQIKKEDGSETARYKFDDKSPVYEVDYSNGQLYYMNGKTLKIFKLQGS